MSEITVLENGPLKFTQETREKFLEYFIETGRVYHSAKRAGVSSETVRHYAKHNIDGFGDDYEEARGLFKDRIEAEIQRRALEGVDEPIIGGKDRDEIVTYVKRYSDRMLEILAKRHISEYGDKQQLDLNVSGGVMIVPGRIQSQEDWIEANSSKRLPGGDENVSKDAMGGAGRESQAAVDRREGARD